MTSWKKRTRALEKAKLQIMVAAENPRNKKSRWALRRMNRNQVHWSHMWGSKLWRNEIQRRNRKREKEIAEALRYFDEYPFIEDCRYHPCKVTELEIEQSKTGYASIEFQCESLLNGSPNACSYFHCGIVHLTKEEAQERVAMVNDLGMFPYQLEKIYCAENSDDVRNILLDLCDMEKIWQFNKNGPEVMTENGKVWLKEKHNIDYDEVRNKIDSRTQES